jgi:hypothetical protein
MAGFADRSLPPTLGVGRRLQVHLFQSFAALSTAVMAPHVHSLLAQHSAGGIYGTYEM